MASAFAGKGSFSIKKGAKFCARGLSANVAYGIANRAASMPGSALRRVSPSSPPIRVRLTTRDRALILASKIGLRSKDESRAISAFDKNESRKESNPKI